MIENEFIAIDVQKAGRRLASVTIQDKINGRSYALSDDIFALTLQDEDTDEACSKKEFKQSTHQLCARDMQCMSLSSERIEGDPNAMCLAARRNTQRINAVFAIPSNGNSISWWIELREGASYCRVGINLLPQQGVMPLRKITLLNIAAPEARVEGSVKGSPIVAAGNRLFAGFESPLSLSEVVEDRFLCSLVRSTNLPNRVRTSFSAILGFCHASQLRRSFQLGYLNEERARPYAPYLNYNSWYDIGYFTRYSEQEAADTVKIFGEELVNKRGAIIDNFLFDDGWDNLETMWEFHEGMPNGFKSLSDLCISYKSTAGCWFSPWGGYGEPKLQRIAACSGAYETNERGFALSGPVYYERFREMCLEMVNNHGIKHFKFDGTSAETPPAPGSQFGSDFEAIISLIDELREAQPELFINLTTGTWASPFWFGIADSIWRGNWDHDFCGEGSERNQWMTFRDGMIYEKNVKLSPLFPINSLMTHGVIYNKGARGLMTKEGDDLCNEIWSGLGLGTQMQELYITPSMMDSKDWDDLAAAAKWSRKHGDIMADTHWVGGNPIDLVVYGWASWSADKAVLTLRNPSASQQDFSFDPAAVFELPLGAPLNYTISSPKGDQLPVEQISVGKVLSLKLKPFEVLVIDATPIN